VEGHCVKSEERSVLHVVARTVDTRRVRFCSYDGIEAKRLIGEYEKRVADERNGEERKRKGSCGRGARRRGRCGGRALGTRFTYKYSIAATLTWQSSSNPKTACIVVLAVRNPVVNALFFLLILDFYRPLQTLETAQQRRPVAPADVTGDRSRVRCPAVPRAPQALAFLGMQTSRRMCSRNPNLQYRRTRSLLSKSQ
jgi:hypothetical protein